MAARILAGDVLDVLPTLQPGSIDCAVTSPPYFQLRSYLPKEHPLKPSELGSDATPQAYVQRMVEVFRLVRTALAEHGTCWVNIGDSYSSDASNQSGTASSTLGGGPRGCVSTGRVKKGATLAPGNLCLIPQRLAIALQDDGWVCRSVIVWHKPAPMPASLAGWRWQRCRVKVKEGGRGGNGRMRRTESPDDYSGALTGMMLAQWADCPGCKKCAPNGGLVLRRSSWRPTSAWEPVLLLAKRQGYY